jgi:hypothetical protein
MHFVAPISGLVVGRWDLDRVGNFLEHRGAVPFVIEEIQRLEKQRTDAAKAASTASAIPMEETPAPPTAADHRPEARR